MTVRASSSSCRSSCFATSSTSSCPRRRADGCNAFAAGICFLPQDPAERAAAREQIEAIAADEGLEVLGWRELPVDPDGADLGATALGCMPYMAQLFVAAPDRSRRHRPRPAGLPDAEKGRGGNVYFPSLSSRTIAYKGMLTTMQLPQYFPDLRDERCMSAIAIVHSRFSTNTFPSWPLAHPFRFVAHNGEINTVRGNRNRMHAREAMLASANIPGDIAGSRRSARPTRRTRRRSTRFSSCCTSVDAASRMRC